MTATYGWRRQGANKIPLPPHESYAHPVLPEKVYNDHSPVCIGCPYPRHGMTCYSKDDEDCLRAQMQKLEAKWQSIPKQSSKATGSA